MELPGLGGVTIKMEPATHDEDGRVIPSTFVEIEVPNIKEECLDYNIPEMDFVTSYVGVIKSEPESLPEEASPTSHRGATLQYGIVKQETEDALAIKCEPGTLAAEEHAQESGEYSEMDIHHPDMKKERFVHLEEINQSSELVSSKSIGKRDLKEKHSVTGKKLFSCPTCTYESCIKGDMVSHIRTHTGEKPFSCTECEYKCSRSNRLAVHLKTHTGEKPFSCSECTYKCSRKDVLVVHVRSHTGEKPFACPECSYKCSRKNNMVVHIRTHTGEKQFSCSKCTYKFYQKGDLIRHSRTHTGEKPFSCSECSYKATQKSTFLIHTRTHTGEKPFSCSICTYRCSKKSSMDVHVKTHTEENPVSCSART